MIKIIGAAGFATGLCGSEARAGSGGTQRTRTLMGDTDQETTLYINDAGTDGMTSFVIGGMHGNEKAGYLAGDDIKNWTPTAGTLLVLPRANIVGIRNGTREGPHGDLNRKFPLEEQPTTELAREIWDIIIEFDPDLVIDMHESVGRYINGRLGQSIGYSPLRDLRGAVQVSIDEINESIDKRKNQFHQRFLPSPAEQPEGVLVQRTGYERGIPTFIIETYEWSPALCARAISSKALVKRLLALRADVFDAEDPRHVIAIEGSGSWTNYTLAVSGTISATDTVSNHDSVTETRVEGAVGASIDYYHYTGRITDFEVTEGTFGDVTVSVDGVEKTNNELTPEETSELRISGTAPEVEYQLNVDESFTATASMEGNDRVFDDRAYGVVRSGTDTYEYRRDIDHFDVTEGNSADLDLEVDGEPVSVEDLDENSGHDLWVLGTARYRFTVSGTVSGTDSLERNDSAADHTGSGGVGGGNDHFRFTGEILSFEIIEGSTDDIEILVDGNKRTIPDLNPADVD